MRELIEEIIQHYDLPTRDCVNGTDETSNIIDAFMDFGKTVCANQKFKCAEDAKILIIDLENKTEIIKDSEIFSDEYYYHQVIVSQSSILKSENVCKD